MSPRLSRRSRVVGAAIGALALLAVGCGEGVTAIERARQAADDNDRARAIGFYEQHLSANPDDFDARLEYTLLLGESWALDGGDRQPIVDNLAWLYEADPSNLRVRELFAMMLVREGQAAVESDRPRDAEAFFLEALDVHPDVGTASYHLGVLYDGLGRSDDAFEAWIVAALKRPPIPDLYLRLGRAYLERGEVDRAINTLELVPELRGISTYLIPEAYCTLAQAHLQRGDEPAAREHLSRAGEQCVVEGLSRG